MAWPLADDLPVTPHRRALGESASATLWPCGTSLEQLQPAAELAARRQAEIVDDDGDVVVLVQPDVERPDVGFGLGVGMRVPIKFR